MTSQPSDRQLLARQSPLRQPVTRGWRPPFQLDLPAVLGPLRRGRGDPAYQTEPAGAVWLTANTTAGPVTTHIRVSAGVVEASAWGDGAEVALDGIPALLGALDDDAGFTAHHPVVADARLRMPWLRLGATGRVWDVLLAAILEQKVTGYEARRSWRELCRRFGTSAPGPAPAGMRVPPGPTAVLKIPDWEWHRSGVDGARRRTILAAASVAHRLESAVELGGVRGCERLRLVPGIGRWTAAEVAQRAWGDPDAVSFGDFHIPTVLGHALTGAALDDAGMAEVLAPYAPQRQRAVRYVEASGFRRPRFGPRLRQKDYRAI